MADSNFDKLAFVASQKPDAQDALKSLVARYGNVDAADADAIIAIGGGGVMLETFRRPPTPGRRGVPASGMDPGTIGF